MQGPVDRPVNLPDHKQCYGCGACAAVCPRQAITLKFSDSGFLVPLANEELCIQCGKCKDACPVINPPGFGAVDQIPPFAAWSKSPKLRRVSSSGGAALSLAGDFLSRGYNFTGAVFEKDFRSVKHVVARSVEDLFETVGSKYVQSNASSAMRQIVDSEHCREESHQGDRHIFFGTPCQVAGLRRLLNSVSRGDPGSAQFFLVDFFCHGVPSYLAWWAFLDEAVIPQTGRLEYIDFRDKSQGWTNYSLVCSGLKGTYVSEFGHTVFGQLFLSDLCLRDSCYTCPYRSTSAADLRIGDFWGHEFDRDAMGVSLIVPITEKGFAAVEENANLVLRSVPLSLLYESQPLILRPALRVPTERKNVMAKLGQGTPLDDIYKTYLERGHKKRLFRRRVSRLLPPSLKKVAKLMARG
jgi:coenzyme F420-reducing hydrogenase beta subunit